MNKRSRPNKTAQAKIHKNKKITGAPIHNEIPKDLLRKALNKPVKATKAIDRKPAGKFFQTKTYKINDAQLHCALYKSFRNVIFILLRR
jgi:hypothetical protein